MIYKNTIVFFFFLFPVLFFAQDSDNSKKVNLNKQAKILAKKQIISLHDGALLIRLKTKKESIAKMRSQGLKNKADLLEDEVEKENIAIVKAFKTEFDFCPTYFFFSDQSIKIKNKDFEKVEFLDENLEHDPAIKLLEDSFLTAEFTQLAQDTAKYFSGYYTVPTENGLERRSRYYGEPSMGLGALVIKSDQFIQLKRPFKYYVRTFKSTPVQSAESVVVEKMNYKLDKFYRKMKKAKI